MSTAFSRSEITHHWELIYFIYDLEEIVGAVSECLQTRLWNKTSLVKHKHVVMSLPIQDKLNSLQSKGNWSKCVSSCGFGGQLLMVIIITFVIFSKIIVLKLGISSLIPFQPAVRFWLSWVWMTHLLSTLCRYGNIHREHDSSEDWSEYVHHHIKSQGFKYCVN